MNLIRGTVKWFKDDKGYGFITRDDGKGDVFVHYSAISGGASGERKSLNKGDVCEFDVVESEKGPKAENLVVIS